MGHCAMCDVHCSLSARESGQQVSQMADLDVRPQTTHQIDWTLGTDRTQDLFPSDE